MRSLSLMVFCLLCLNFHASYAQVTIVDDVSSYNPTAEKYNTEGYLLLGKGRAAEAKAFFIRAIALDSAEINYYLNLGNACHQTKDWTTALKFFSQAIRVHPQEPDLYYYRAEVYNKQQDYQKAIIDFSAAIRLGGGKDPVPLLYLYYFNRGVAYLKLQKYADSVKDFTETLTLNEAHYGAYANRGMAKFNTQDKAGACQDWNKAYSLGYEGVKNQLINHCR